MSILVNNGAGGGSIPEPPENGDLYSRKNKDGGLWAPSTISLTQAEYNTLVANNEDDPNTPYFITDAGGGGDIPEPPSDNKLYARRHNIEGEWMQATISMTQAEYTAAETAGTLIPDTPYFITDGESTSLTLHEILDAVFPIGSTYTSKSSTMPANIAALGTWVRLEGVFIAAASDSDSDFSVGDTVRGAKTITLQQSQMPNHSHPFTGNAMDNHIHSQSAHTHNVRISWQESVTAGQAALSVNVNGTQQVVKGSAVPSAQAGVGIDQGQVTNGTSAANTGNASAGTPTGTIGAIGSNSPHDNMPPYLTRYMWERTG